MNADLAGYHVPVNADVPSLEALLVHEDDPYVNALGVKGVGEIGITGTVGAIANAVWHATGIRARRFPIHPEALLVGGLARDRHDLGALDPGDPRELAQPRLHRVAVGNALRAQHLQPHGVRTPMRSRAWSRISGTLAEKRCPSSSTRPRISARRSWLALIRSRVASCTASSTLPP